MTASAWVFRHLSTIVLCLAAGVSGCVQQAPPELLQAVENLDRELATVQGAAFAPEEYAQFVEHWVAVKGGLLADEAMIRWPWEANPLAADLRKLQAEGELAVSAATQRKEAQRMEAEDRLAVLEERLRVITDTVEEIGSRAVLEQRPVQTELLVRQARSFFEQGLFSRSVLALEQASHLMDLQTVLVSTALARYADERRVAVWRHMVRRTVEWSKIHRAAAIIVNKADGRLTLYRSGRPVATYHVRLGYNGVLEKRYQGDGATPEGRYRVIRKRDTGQTRFYRALLLDYPNAEDVGRFRVARGAGTIPDGALIGGQIEIHGGDDTALSRTLGCVMLENSEIDVVFEAAEVGTPVTIVGAVDRANAVALALATLERVGEEEAEQGAETQETQEAYQAPDSERG